jgi:hypothetical protein
MLVQVTASLLLLCLANGVPLPNHMFEYNDAAIKLVVQPDPAFIVQDTMMRMCQFRAEIVKGSLSDPQDIIAKALDFDGRLLKISTDVPPGWEYETVFTDEDPGIIYNGCYHIYYDHVRKFRIRKSFICHSIQRPLQTLTSLQALPNTC